MNSSFYLILISNKFNQEYLFGIKCFKLYNTVESIGN